MEGKNILHTAHRISTSHSSFEKMKKYLEKMGMADKVDFMSIKAKGQEKIEIPRKVLFIILILILLNKTLIIKLQI